MSDDYSNTTSTTGTISVGGSATGNIETVDDTDWFRITLTAGRTYQFDLKGSASGHGTLADPFLRLRDSSGNPISGAYSDDGGTDTHPRLRPARYAGLRRAPIAPRDTDGPDRPLMGCNECQMVMQSGVSRGARTIQCCTLEAL